MEATLYEILNLGREIHKHYALEKPISMYNKKIENFVIIYDQENLKGEIVNLDTEDLITMFDLSFYNKVIDYDIVMDKNIIREHLKIRNITLYKECDDFPDLN